MAGIRSQLSLHDCPFNLQKSIISNKLYRQIVGIPMGTNCALLVADLFLFCYERDLMTSLSNDNQADIIEAFNTTSRYLDNLFNTDNPVVKEWSTKFIHLS